MTTERIVFLKKIGAGIAAAFALVSTLQAIMEPKDSWFWASYHYVPFFLLPMAAGLIAALLYPY